MKILHTADWHIGQFKGPVVDGVNLRSQDTIKCLEYMVEVAQKEKPDIVCISGDIFHQEQIGPVRYSDEMIHATNIITALAHLFLQAKKDERIAKFEWIKRIVVEADYNGIPVFMKDSLVPIIGEKNMRRDYPKELQIRKRSEKVNKRLSGSCMLCGKTEDKNKMVTLTARAVRGGKAASFGHMCHSCFTKWSARES